MSLTFGEQVKIVLKNRNMTIKDLADKIENYTGKPMSRQNLTQKLGRNNFQEHDMRMIADILSLNFTLDILSGEDIKLPVDKVLEGNMTIDEVLNLESKEENPDKDDSAFKMVNLKAEEKKEEEQLEEIARFAGRENQSEVNLDTQLTNTSGVNPDIESAKLSEMNPETADSLAHKEKADNAQAGAVDSVTFMKKQSTFEEQPIDMYNYRSKKDLFFNLEEVGEEKPAKSSDELIADILREMEEIEREQKEQQLETKERQEKWEQEKKSKGFRSILSGFFGLGKKKQETATSEEGEDSAKTLEAATESSNSNDVAENESSREAVAEAVDSEKNSQVSEAEAEKSANEYADANVSLEEIASGEEIEGELEEIVEESAKSESKETEESEQIEDAKSAAQEEKTAAGEVKETAETSEKAEAAGKENEENVKAVEEEKILGEINPYTGKEYESFTVRNHKNKIGYVEVYSREKHAWEEMTEWAFLGYQEKRKVELGKKYKPPFFMD